jgi:hypothetical protein
MAIEVVLIENTINTFLRGRRNEYHAIDAEIPNYVQQKLVEAGYAMGFKKVSTIPLLKRKICCLLW